MFGVNDLITKINAAIASGTATEDQIEYLSSAVNSLRQYGTAIAATPTDLPNPVTNKGRFFYVKSTGQYTFSNGVVWDINGILRPSITPLYAWGSNSYGQLGNNTTTDKSSPVSVVGGITDWVQVSAGNRNNVALKSNGTAWAWGDNQFGRLGDGTTIARSSPVSVVGGFTNWAQVSAGVGHTVGLRSNGTAWAWGTNTVGQLGDGTASNRSSPVSVVGGFADWVQMSAGGEHTVGLRSNGTAWAWGQNGNAQLGDNTLTSKSSPVSVVGGFTDWVHLSANRLHTAGVRASGTIWAWGNNNFGQLGNNAIAQRSSPVSVVGGFTDWVQVSTGYRHTVAVRANGTAWAWGYNAFGQLGNNTTTSVSSPVSVVGGFTDWVQVSSGAGMTVALRASGTAWGWGYNIGGQLGDNGFGNRSSPVSVVGGFTDWVQISAGNNHGIGVRAT